MQDGIVIDGHLGARWEAWFDGFTPVDDVEDPATAPEPEHDPEGR